MHPKHPVLDHKRREVLEIFRGLVSHETFASGGCIPAGVYVREGKTATKARKGIQQVHKVCGIPAFCKEVKREDVSVPSGEFIDKPGAPVAS